MKKKLFTSVFLLASFVSFALNINFYQKIQEENRVIEVADGDTFQLKSGKRVRLMGVDAPEYDYCGGQEAKARLQELILNKKVKLEEEISEAFGRALALVWVDKSLVNQMMLKEGWGRPDYRKNSQRDVLTAAYHEAQAGKVGLFSLCISTHPFKASCLIKGNIDQATYQKFYHLPTCRHYQEVKLNLAFGEQWFCSEKEALAAGFKKASGCP